MATNIRKSIQNKIESLTKEVENAQMELKKWERIAADYETNRESIDSILSIQLMEATENPRPKKAK